MSQSEISESSLLAVRIEPDSPQMKAQSVLKACSVNGRYFTFGRRSSRRYSRTETDLPDHRIANEYPYTVSRLHCEIERIEGQVIIRDLNSRFGTVVNGHRLLSAEESPAEISLGVGEHSLVLGRSRGDVRFRLIITGS